MANNVNKARKNWAIMDKYVSDARHIVDWLGDDTSVKYAARFNNSIYKDNLYHTLIKCAMAKGINWHIRPLDKRPTARYIYNKLYDLYLL